MINYIYIKNKFYYIINYNTFAEMAKRGTAVQEYRALTVHPS